MQARYAILRVLLEAGQGLVSVSSEKVALDRSKILSVGRPAIGSFLQKLNVYKVQFFSLRTVQSTARSPAFGCGEAEGPHLS
jgi:hypothetical protein